MDKYYSKAPNLERLTVKNVAANFGKDSTSTGVTMFGSEESTSNLAEGTIENLHLNVGKKNKIENLQMGGKPSAGTTQAASSTSVKEESYCLGDKTGDSNRGLVLVLSYDKFKDAKLNRAGNGKDVCAVQDTFGKQDFYVIVEKDKTKQETWQILDKASKNEDYSVYSCFVLVILSHGEENGFLCQDGQVLTYETMFECFHQNGCQFVGKPKLFFIQACRGNKSDHGRVVMQGDGQPEIESDRELWENPTPNPKIIPTTADMFAFYSSYNGYESFRDTISGSWFIQTLCSTIDKLADVEHLQDICERVGVVVSSREINDEHGLVYKQIPKFESTLHKKIYFYK